MLLQVRKKLPGLVVVQVFPAVSEKFGAHEGMAGLPFGCRVPNGSRFACCFPGFSTEKLALREPPRFSANWDGWSLKLWDLISGCISTFARLHLLLYSVLHPYQMTGPADWPFSLPAPRLCPCFPLSGRQPSPAILRSSCPLWQSVMSPSPRNFLHAFSTRAQSYHGLHWFTGSLCFSQLSYSLSPVEQTWEGKLLIRCDWLWQRKNTKENEWTKQMLRPVGRSKGRWENYKYRHVQQLWACAPEAGGWVLAFHRSEVLTRVPPRHVSPLIVTSVGIDGF